MSSRTASLQMSLERLITTEGTIIPQAVRFADGTLLVCYSVGQDAWFAPRGAHRSTDDGNTWEKVEPPLHSGETMGEIGSQRALFFESKLWQTAPDRYVAIYNETRDAGASFLGPKLAEIHLEGALASPYVPRQKEDPDYFYEPEIPAFYDLVTKDYGAVIGGHLFGRIVRLPDGALGMSAYCRMKDNVRRKDRQSPSTYVGSSPAEGVAPEGVDDVLWSSIFLRSEDEGQTWHKASTILAATESFPFDVGVLYSEGFTETGLSCTSEGKIYALLRHGSYMLLWTVVSADGGRTWSEPLCFNYPGVAPSLCLMPNGVLAAAWGRPGMSVAFSLDGTGQSWDAIIGVMQDDAQSQKYPWIVPLADNRLMLFYDRRKWDAARRVHVDHGIYCREITISI